MAIEDRNPFTTLLLIRFIENEARRILGTGREKLIDYLAIPRHANQVSDFELIRKFTFGSKIDENYAHARSAVGKVIQRPYIFSYSDDLLNTIARRLTCYGLFETYTDFENYYRRASKHFDKYIGKKLTASRIAYIEDQVFDVVRSETIYTELVGRFSGITRKNIIRLSFDRILRPADESEFDQREDEGFRYKAKPVVEKIDLLVECEMLVIDGFTTYYVGVDPHNRVISDVRIIPLNARWYIVEQVNARGSVASETMRFLSTIIFQENKDLLNNQVLLSGEEYNVRSYIDVPKFRLKDFDTFKSPLHIAKASDLPKEIRVNNTAFSIELNDLHKELERKRKPFTKV